MLDTIAGKSVVIYGIDTMAVQEKNTFLKLILIILL